MATRIGRFLARPPAERRLFLQALWRVMIVRIQLTLRPFASVHEGVRRLGRRSSPLMTGLSSRTIAASVRSAARFVPGASCLTQALAAHVLLEQGAHPSMLHIGVSRERGRFEAHAWVEEDGSILIGELDRNFVPLPKIK